MKSYLPTSADVRQLAYKSRRKKFMIPDHAEVSSAFVRELDDLQIRRDRTSDEKERSRLDHAIHELVLKKTSRENEIFQEQAQLLADVIVSRAWEVNLRRTRRRKGRRIYTFKSAKHEVKLLDAFISSKLRDAFQVQVRSRDSCVRYLVDHFSSFGVSDSTNGKIHQTIIRCDIADFYESISHAELIKKLSGHRGIPDFIIEYTIDLLRNFQCVSSSSSDSAEERGVPAGISVSSTLAEIALEDLDRIVRTMPGVGLYIRYVDDIVIACEPSQEANVLKKIDRELGRWSLRRHLEGVSKKATVIRHPDEAATGFDYLGYRFLFDEGSCEFCSLDISTEKMNRYLRALHNLEVHIDSGSYCWADPEGPDFAILLFREVIYPQYSLSRYGNWRTVSGLAYSARLCTQYAISRQHSRDVNRGDPWSDFPIDPPHNVETIQKAARNILCRILGRLKNPRNPGPAKCPHCQRRCGDLRPLRRLKEELETPGQILMRPAILKTADVRLKDKARKILWN